MVLTWLRFPDDSKVFGGLKLPVASPKVTMICAVTGAAPSGTTTSTDARAPGSWLSTQIASTEKFLIEASGASVGSGEGDGVAVSVGTGSGDVVGSGDGEAEGSGSGSAVGLGSGSDVGSGDADGSGSGSALSLGAGAEVSGAGSSVAVGSDVGCSTEVEVGELVIGISLSAALAEVVAPAMQTAAKITADGSANSLNALKRPCVVLVICFCSSNCEHANGRWRSCAPKV